MDGFNAGSVCSNAMDYSGYWWIVLNMPWIVMDTLNMMMGV